MNTLQSELVAIGLSTQQAAIYLQLIDHGELRIQEIASLTKIPRSSVYENVKRLFELGIAEEIIQGSFKRIRPYSIGAMQPGIDEKIVGMQRLKNKMKALEKVLSVSPAQDVVNLSAVRYYKGRSGAQQLFWNTLKTTGTVYVMSDWGRGRYVGMKFYEKFVTESRRRQVTEKVLINPSTEALQSIREFTHPGSAISRTRLEDIRAIPETDVKITGESLIYNNIFATVYLKTVEINGFEIESQYFVETQRAIFETLWRIGRPLYELLPSTTQ